MAAAFIDVRFINSEKILTVAKKYEHCPIHVPAGAMIVDDSISIWKLAEQQEYTTDRKTGERRMKLGNGGPASRPTSGVERFMTIPREFSEDQRHRFVFEYARDLASRNNTIVQSFLVPGEETNPCMRALESKRMVTIANEKITFGKKRQDHRHIFAGAAFRSQFETPGQEYQRILTEWARKHGMELTFPPKKADAYPPNAAKDFDLIEKLLRGNKDWKRIFSPRQVAKIVIGKLKGTDADVDAFLKSGRAAFCFDDGSFVLVTSKPETQGKEKANAQT